MKAAAEEGRWTFPAPLGYRTVTTSVGSRMEPDPDRAPLVRSAFELFATGKYEQQQVLKKITAKGLRTRRGKKVPLQSFNSMLRKPIYAGRICISSWAIDRRGDFVPIVSDETFHRVQVLLSGRRTIAQSYTKQHPDFPLRHFVRCARCEKPLTASWSRGRSKRYAYYRCSMPECKFVNAPKPVVENAFIELLRGLQPKPTYMRLFKAIVLDVWKAHQAEAANTSQLLRTRIDKISERKNRLDEAYIYERKIDDQTYQTQQIQLREEKALAEMELNEARVVELDLETVVNFAIEAIGDASRFWLDGTIDQKQRFQQMLFPSGIAFDGKQFGTAPTCLAFSYLQQVSTVKSSLASRTGVEPVSPP